VTGAKISWSGIMRRLGRGDTLHVVTTTVPTEALFIVKRKTSVGLYVTMRHIDAPPTNHFIQWPRARDVQIIGPHTWVVTMPGSKTAWQIVSPA
jgi:hypothetical protein